MALLDAHIRTSGYGRVAVLQDLAVEVAERELVAVLGSNGAGKTTLLRTLSGVLVRADARIIFAGDDITRTPAYHRTRKGLAHVPEGRRVFGELSVAENLWMGGFVRRRGALEPRLEEVCDLFPILADRRDQPAASLSGGEQQMLAIARGLISGPRLLMVDEASLGLAPATIDRLFDALRVIADAGTAVLLVEQNARASLEIADRAYVLERGRTVLSGRAADLLHDDRLTAAYLGGRVDVVGPSRNGRR
jgi:branched-chain amino acid transport system ATP-binding protein